MENLKPNYGAVKKKKRIGRGPGSGLGKTSGKGHKGQKARKGGGVRLGFEGGQTPLYRRLPKKGFKNARFKKDFNEINVFMLNKFDDNSVVGVEEYEKIGVLSSKRMKVKILGSGEIKKKLEIHADKFSKTALSKIEAAGGKAVIRT
ncbi:MAG: 50S ribosomal protein L15 [Spirochaetes bacterium]|nr:50S ribosomal protein L15 [Spirochaetota bacterium]